MEEADRVERLRLKTRNISLDLSMRPVSVAFENQDQWALETGVRYLGSVRTGRKWRELV